MSPGPPASRRGGTGPTPESRAAVGKGTAGGASMAERNLTCAKAEARRERGEEGEAGPGSLAP